MMDKEKDYYDFFRKLERLKEDIVKAEQLPLDLEIIKEAWPKFQAYIEEWFFRQKVKDEN